MLFNFYKKSSLFQWYCHYNNYQIILWSWNRWWFSIWKKQQQRTCKYFLHDSPFGIDTFIFIYVNLLQFFSFQVLSLTSKYACPKSTHHITGVGAFFLIITVMIAIYFFGGILVLKFIRGAKGVEMIPNHEFWCRVVNLVKVRFLFLL